MFMAENVRKLSEQSAVGVGISFFSNT